MKRISIRCATLSVALCLTLPSTLPAQRIDALLSGVAAPTTPHLAYEAERWFAQMQSAGQPNLLRHSLYGALAGAVLWGAYFALPCDSGCRTEGAREERIILLPVAVATGAAIGLVTGVVRRAR